MSYNFDQYTPVVDTTSYPATFNTFFETLDTIFDVSATFKVIGIGGAPVAGAGITIANNTAATGTQYGIRVDDLTSGAINYAFRGGVTAGANKYNLLIDSSAQNYLAGQTFLSTLAPLIDVNARLAVLQVTGNAVAAEFTNSGNQAPIYLWNRAAGGDNPFITFATEASITVRGSIDFNRSGSLTRYNTTSDARLKTKHGAAAYDPTWIERVASTIFAVTWNETGHRTDTFIAQDLHSVEPNAVSVGDAGPLTPDSKIWGIDPSKLVAKLILEVHHHADRLAALER